MPRLKGVETPIMSLSDVAVVPHTISISPTLDGALYVTPIRSVFNIPFVVVAQKRRTRTLSPAGTEFDSFLVYV